MEGGNRDFAWPVPSTYGLSSCFKDGRNHDAIDIAGAARGADVVASYDGTVYATGYSAPSATYQGYGYYVVLKHNYTLRDGSTTTLYSKYNHLDSIKVSEGQSVIRGVTVVGGVGDTGGNYPVHLDFQILNSSNYGDYHNTSIDPYINDLLEPPTNVWCASTNDCCGIGPSGCCCKLYLNVVKEQYSHPLVPVNVTPGKPALSNFKRSYASGESVVFKWDSTENTTHYNLYIDKQNSSGDWERCNTYHYATNGYSTTFSDGIYRALIQSTNSNASGWPYTDGDWVNFAVGSHTHDKGTYVWYEDTHPHCKCYECSYCGEIWKDRNSSTYLDECLECHRPEKPVVIGVNDSYIEQESVVVNWTYGSNTTHCNYWLYKKTGDEWKTVHNIFYATGPVVEMLEAGEYRVKIGATNKDYWEADGSTWLWKDSDYVYFTVYERTKISFDTNGGYFPNTVESFEISGINTPRGEHQLVVFTGDGLVVDTNYYGFEVAVNKQGKIIAQRLYGDENHLTIPLGGFVLSAHGGESSPDAAFVAYLNVGDYVAYDKATMMAYHYTSYDEYLSAHKYVIENTGYDDLPEVQKEGYYFKGWYLSDGDTSAVNYLTDCTSSQLYARWDETPTPFSSVVYNNHKYELFDYHMSWTDAKVFCEAMGGHLVTISDSGEQAEVLTLAKTGSFCTYYIGCSDAETEGTWKWVTGELVDYQNWDTDAPEPSHGDGENYAHLLTVNYGPNKQVGEWNDVENDTKYGFYGYLNGGFICEYDVVCEHDYVPTVTLSTCTEQGFTTYTCSQCGDSYVDDYVPATGHHFENGVCSVCGTLEAVISVGTTSAKAGETVSLPVSIQNNSGFTGFRLKVMCDDALVMENITPGELLQGKNGSFSRNVNEGRVNWFGADNITNNGVLFNLSISVPEGTADGVYTIQIALTDDSNFDFVDDKSESIPVLFTSGTISVGHDHSYNSVVTNPTCTAQGYTTHTCSICGDNYRDSYVDALGHNYGAWVQKIAPTCTEKGEEKRTCSRCNATETRAINALGHDLTHHAAKAPTCAEIGWNAYDTCSRCDYTTYVEKAALGHSYQAVVTAPTCTAGGYTTYTCSRCGDSYVANEVSALGHTPGTAVEENRVNPTCTVNGGFDTVTYCSVCGVELTRVHTGLAALGHVWDNGVVNPAATCTSGGVKTYTCQRCGETKNEAIAASGHTPGESVKENEVAATCTTAGGYDMVVRCKVCNAILYAEHFEIAALGHDYQAVVTDPTCTEKGYTTYACSRCGDSYVADETAALGHTPGEPVKENEVAPTCETAGGYDMVIYCTVCGAEISREHTDIPALGHDWNAPEYVWADDYSTVTATRICKNDASHVETETVDTSAEVTKEATYEEEGEITYTAIFENVTFATQTKVVATPKLDGPKPYEPCDGGENCPGNVFTDMPPKGNWAHDAIDWAIVNKITSGTGANTFSPNAGCTRAQVVTFLWRAAGSPEPETSVNPFGDVKEGAYYYKAVLWAAENGITAGTSATTFSPDATCTRGQIVTFLWRYEGEPAAMTTSNPFADVKAGAYYEKAVLWASETGVTAGTSATTFSPDNTCTRAQVVTFLYRDMNK